MITPSSLSKIRLLDGNSTAHTNAFPQKNWQKWFGRRPHSAVKIAEKVLYVELGIQIARVQIYHVCIFPEDGSLIELFTQRIHL